MWRGCCGMGARGQPGTARLGTTRQGDAHGGPCWQELLEEQVPSLLTPLASSAGAGGSWRVSGRRRLNRKRKRKQ